MPTPRGEGLYIKVPMDSGGAFFVEATATESGMVRAGRGEDLLRSATQTFEESMVQVRQIAEAILEKLSGMHTAPGEIRAQFGVSLGAEAGVVVAKGTADAHLVLELTWKREAGAQPAP